MTYKFFLNDYECIENPVGWDQMNNVFARDKDIKGVLANLDATLTFTNDGYDKIVELTDSASDGYCSQIELRIERSIDNGQNYIEREKGLLKQSSMVFDEFNCSVQVKVTDNSFYGVIDRRKSSEFYPTADRTVNADDTPNITPAPIYEMELFDPATATAVATVQPFGCYRVYDVLNHLVGSMSDNEVEFDSPIFSISGEFANLMLTYGFVIRSTGNATMLTLGDFTTNMPPISFEQLFKELDKRFNLGVYFDNTGQKPKLIIDEWNNLFRNNEITSFINLPNLKTQTAKELIYSNIKFGGTKTLDIIAASFPERIRFVGFNNEQYLIVGDCPVDNTLDLSYNFVSSSNVIEEILILSGTDDTYDDDWFLIDCDRNANRLVAKQSNWLEPAVLTPMFYNERLTNYQIAQRYLNAVPNTIAAYLGNGDNTFLAEKTTFQYATFGGYTTIIFQDDFTFPNHDTGNNFNVVNGRYTAVNPGVYTFQLHIEETYMPIGGNVYFTGYYIERYDSGSVLIERREVGRITTNSTASETYVSTFNAQAGDYFIATFREANGTINNAAVEARSTFACLTAADGGGRYQTYNPSDYPIKESIFTTEIKDSQTDLIRDNPLSLIRFYVDSTNQKTGWISELQINEFTGIVNAKLLTSGRRFGVEFPPEIRYVLVTGQLHDNPFTLFPADRYGSPASNSDTTTKVYFYEVGKELTVTIPATYLGLPVNPSVSIAVTRYNPAYGSLTETVNTLSHSFFIESGTNYVIQFAYSLIEVGDTYPSLQPIVTPPATLGDDGIATITCVSPNNPADYTFLWSTGATTQQITAPPGDYTCLVTNINPGTYDNNSILFNIQIPLSQTGQ